MENEFTGRMELYITNITKIIISPPKCYIFYYSTSVLITIHMRSGI